MSVRKEIDMNTQLIAVIEKQMRSSLSDAQAEKLHQVLLDTIGKAPETAETEKPDLVQLFLAAKRVEGCSDKTVRYYESTIQIGRAHV